MRSMVIVGLVSLVICGCGSAGGSSSTPPPQSAVTSIGITPSSANVAAGQQQQFSATVSGTGNFSQAVTWSVAGDGTIDSNGLFTAGTTSGLATVQVASVEDPMVINSAAVTVSATQADLGDWYGSLTRADGTQSMPLDFHLAQNGTALNTSHQTTTWGFGPVALETANLGQSQAVPCANLYLFAKPDVNANTGQQVSPNSELNNTSFSLSGTVNGNGQVAGAVSLNLQVISLDPAGTENLTLTGQFDASNSTLSGTYTNSGYLAGCFLSQTSGTFSFTKYLNAADEASWTYKGTFNYGTAGPVTLTFTSGPAGVFTMGPIPGVCASAVSVNLREDVSNGRYFHLLTDNVGQSELEVWGMSNDTQAQTITIFTALLGSTPGESPCITNVEGNNLISNITLTKTAPAVSNIFGPLTLTPNAGSACIPLSASLPPTNLSSVNCQNGAAGSGVIITAPVAGRPFTSFNVSVSPATPPGDFLNFSLIDFTSPNALATVPANAVCQIPGGATSCKVAVSGAFNLNDVVYVFASLGPLNFNYTYTEITLTLQ